MSTKDLPALLATRYMSRRRTTTYFFVGIVSVILLTKVGCEYIPESTFALASTSRLPRWVSSQPENKSAKVDLTMSYYLTPFGGNNVLFELRDGKGQRARKLYGRTLCKSFTLALGTNKSGFDYPAYQAVTVNGVTEIIEHKQMEPIFYVTDEPAVWDKLTAIGCTYSNREKK